MLTRLILDDIVPLSIALIVLTAHHSSSLGVWLCAINDQPQNPITTLKIAKFFLLTSVLGSQGYNTKASV